MFLISMLLFSKKMETFFFFDFFDFELRGNEVESFDLDPFDMDSRVFIL
jgi:hypothetical protein